MIYDLTNEFDKGRFTARVMTLLQKGSVIELTEKALKSRNQNHYMHLLIGVVAMEVGETIEYAKKEYFKKLVNRDIFIVNKKDRFAGDVEVIRSCKELTREEMSTAIDRFKRWGSQNGIYMPNPDDTSLLQMIEIEMGRIRHYL